MKKAAFAAVAVLAVVGLSGSNLLSEPARDQSIIGDTHEPAKVYTPLDVMRNEAEDIRRQYRELAATQAKDMTVEELERAIPNLATLRKKLEEKEAELSLYEAVEALRKLVREQPRSRAAERARLGLEAMGFGWPQAISDRPDSRPRAAS